MTPANHNPNPNPNPTVTGLRNNVAFFWPQLEGTKVAKEDAEAALSLHVSWIRLIIMIMRSRVEARVRVGVKLSRALT